MSRFIVGDELGNLKFLAYACDSDSKVSLDTITGDATSKGCGAVQALAVSANKLVCNLLGYLPFELSS